LGPKQFRDESSPKQFEDEDFDSCFPPEKRPNFFEEFKYFRIPDQENPSTELSTDMLLDFCHFEATASSTETFQTMIGTPPTPTGMTDELEGHHASFPYFGESAAASRETPCSSSLRRSSLSLSGRSTSAVDLRALDEDVMWQSSDDVSQQEPELTKRRASRDTSLSLDSLYGLGGSIVGASSRDKDEERRNKQWMFSQVKWLGEVATVWPMDATPSQIEERSVPRLEIFRMPGGAEYIIHDVDEKNQIVGKARFSGTFRVPDEIAVEGFIASDEEESPSLLEISSSLGELSLAAHPPLTFHPPSFGVTVLGNSHGFDKNGSTSGYVLWINGRGVMVDPPPYSSATLEREGIRPQVIIGVIITHCHADHDAGAFQKLLTGSRVSIITTPSIYKSFIRKYAALSGLGPDLLRRSHRFRPAIIGQPLRFQGATFHFTYSLHTIPCIGFKAEWRGKSIVFTGDHLNSPPVLDELQQSVS